MLFRSLVRAWITVAENKTIEPIRPIAAMGIGPMLDHCDASTVLHPPNGPQAGPHTSGMSPTFSPRMKPEAAMPIAEKSAPMRCARDTDYFPRAASMRE